MNQTQVLRGLQEALQRDMDEADRAFWRGRIDALFVEPQPKLFYVMHSTPDGESADLIVKATDSKDVPRIWREYFCDWGLPAKPKKIFEIPLDGAIGAVSWTMPNLLTK